ncbi:MAG: TOMM precursor leader peptide-binding protein [Burkholderiaceae bacterium]|nr:TOMM precursor leader peptide-binding protein [Burkholderiaceae bacterium]
MIKTPAFKAHLHVQVMPDEGVLILSEDASSVLYGAAYEKVSSLVDGLRSTDEIVDTLAGQVDAVTVYYAIDQMARKGHLAEASLGIAPSVAAFWHGQGVDPAHAVAALRGKSVAVQTLGSVNASALQTALAQMEIRLADPSQADLWVVVTDNYLAPELAAINAQALKTKRAWLLLRMAGPEAWLGPLFEPAADKGCWSCLRQRLARNRAVHGFVARKNKLDNFPATALGALPATEAVACNLAALAAAQFLAGAPAALSGKVMSLAWTGMQTTAHALLRHPHCAACGESAVAVPQALVLQPGKAAFVRDGGHRVVPPEKTFKKYEHLVSPITGVVTKLALVSEADGMAHVYVAGHNPVARIERLADLRAGLRNASSGKGVSDAQARVSALCEAIERYSGELTGGELRVTRAFRDWPEGDAIHPRDIMFYSDQQYADKAAWDARASQFNRVPEPFNDAIAVDWTPVWSLTHQRHKYLPTQLMYYCAPASESDDTFYCLGCSNGNASGNTLEEAILQGFFELVERDAVAIWWYNRLHRPAVALQTFGEPYLLALKDFYLRQHQREVWALDLTSDLGIPVFVAVSRRISNGDEHLLFGLGCHLDARIALQRAFAEMNQMLGMAHSGPDGKMVVEDKEVLSWLRTATLANQPYLAADVTKPLKSFTDYPLQHSGDFLQDIAHCRQIVESRGMEMLVLDQTRADVCLPAVKVVVPGLRHFWARYASGRLYDVPVRMGWLDRPLREEDLNPIPIFI